MECSVWSRDQSDRTPLGQIPLMLCYIVVRMKTGEDLIPSFGQSPTGRANGHIRLFQNLGLLAQLFM